MMRLGTTTKKKTTTVTSLSDEDLADEKRELIAERRKHAAAIDRIDTELIGVREELRRREHKKWVEKNYPD